MHQTKTNKLLRYLQQFKKYKPLMRELVARDLKVKYRRSVLGYLWSLLNPLLMMMVLSFVFSYMFQRFNIPNYPLYLICGQTLWQFFNEATNTAMHSVISNGPLIKKVYIPKYIFPVSKVLSSFVTTSFSLVAIIIVVLFTKSPISWTFLLAPIPLFFLLVFSSGVGLVLAALSVYFRDIMHLYGVITLAWMYATPIFYPLEALPPQAAVIMKFNPMYQFIKFFRSLILYNTVPGLRSWLVCAGVSLGSLLVGILIFRRLQKNFILYI